MSKSKRTSKAKRPRTIPRDPETGQQFIFDPATGEPTRRYRHRRLTAEQIKAEKAARAARRQRQEERRAAFRERLARSPVEMQRREYRLPGDVAAFLDRLFLNPLTWHDQRQQVSVAEAHEMIDAAYMEGCRQGFIEGRVLDLEPKRQRSAKANAAKRQKPREHNGMRYTLDQRDAAIVAEYAVLRPMVGATEAQYRLAQKYDLSDKMVRIIVSKAKRAAP